MYNELQSIIKEEVKRVLNEIYKRRNNSVLELGVKAVSKKRKYANSLWNKLQAAYSYIGGCKSFEEENGDGGFKNFLTGKYIWRIYFGNSKDEIRGAAIYKPTPYGRKRICSFGINLPSYTKTIDNDFNKFNHVYGEVSGKAEKVMQRDKRTNWLSKEEASDVLHGKQIGLEQNKEIDKNEKLPYNKERHYYRELGDEGEIHRKAMYGYPIRRKK